MPSGPGGSQTNRKLMVSIKLVKMFRFGQITVMYPLAREFEERL